uniref:Uncharacterized protein n=1 Tax=Aegilops tauschii subsp. strangulata TaxID=200361 RepID=A0A453GYL3_AEGTS
MQGEGTLTSPPLPSMACPCSSSSCECNTSPILGNEEHKQREDSNQLLMKTNLSSCQTSYQLLIYLLHQLTYMFVFTHQPCV